MKKIHLFLIVFAFFLSSLLFLSRSPFLKPQKGKESNFFPTTITPKKEKSPLKKEIKKELTIKKPENFYLLPASTHTYQTWNNCGPATLSMTLSLFDIKKTQAEIGEYLRPIQDKKGQNDDKAVFPKEIVNYLKEQGLEGRFLVNGDQEKLKKFLVNDIPVIVKQLLKINDDPGHYRLLRGFDEKNHFFIIDDSYFGPNFKLSYQRFNELWRPFNYGYIVVYRFDKKDVVEEILGEEKNKKLMYENALKRAEKELKKEPDNIYSLFNLAESYFYLGNYLKAKEIFEKAKKIGLPRRMLWYHPEAIAVYNKVGEYDKVFIITEEIFKNGNPAYEEAYFQRGIAYLGKGEKEKAKEEFQKALFYNKNYKEAEEALEKL